MSSPSPTTAKKSGQEGKQSKVIQYIKGQLKLSSVDLYVLNIKFSSANDDNGNVARAWFYKFIGNGGKPHQFKYKDLIVKIKWEAEAGMQSSAYYLSKSTLDVGSSVTDDIYCQTTDSLIQHGLSKYSSENPDDLCGWTLDHLLTKTVQCSAARQQDDGTANNTIVPPTRQISDEKLVDDHGAVDNSIVHKMEQVSLNQVVENGEVLKDACSTQIKLEREISEK